MWICSGDDLRESSTLHDIVSTASEVDLDGLRQSAISDADGFGVLRIGKIAAGQS